MARFSISQLARLCRRVGTAVDAGIDDRRIWDREAESASPLLKPALEKVAKLVGEGHSLADALVESGGKFPPLMCEMVRAGEHSGRQGDVFLQLADHYDNLLRLRRTFLSGILWPAFEFAAAIVIVGLLILALGIVARMTGGDPIDLFGLGFGTTGNFILYVFLVTCVLTAIAVPIIGTMRGWFGSAPIRMAQRIPLLGRTIEILSLSRLAWSLGMAIDAGMDAIKSTRLALSSSQNPLYTEQTEKVHGMIEQGNEIHVALAATDAFPNDFLNTLENAEMTGQITESMARLSAEYRGQAEHLFRTLAMVGGALVMLLVGVILVFLIFTLFTQLILDPINDAASGL